MDQLLIVGGGLAGSILAQEAANRGISFKWIISDKIPAASFSAYGMCNPVHFRNMVTAWKAEGFYETSKSFFLEAEEKFGAQFLKEMPTHHLVVDPAEFVQWRQNVESTNLWKYTTGDPSTEMLPYIRTGYSGSIRIKESFFVDIPEFVNSSRTFFKEHIIWNDVQCEDVQPKDELWSYQGNTYPQVVFAEGSHGYSNPFFKHIPFNPCKGQIVLLKIPGLSIAEAIHKKIVLIPLGNEHFICGATYEWNDMNDTTTNDARVELEKDLQEIIGYKYPYEVLDQKAGVRPTISDRRPVVGWHPAFKGIGILNGFGTRGLLVGPACAKDLLNNMQNGSPILTDWDINRFKKRLLKNL